MQIRFSFETPYGQYSDCLNLDDDNQFTDAEIEAMQIQRRDNWIAFVESSQNSITEETVPTDPVINVDNTSGV